MKKLKIFLTFILLLSLFNVHAQLKVYNSGNVGIATTNPYSKLSIGGYGSASYYTSINNPLTGNSTGTMGIALINATATSGSDKVFGLYSTTTGGRGYNRAVFGYSYSGTYLGGRSYGVMGFAGGCTPRYNFGLYGMILGSYDGAALWAGTSSYSDDNTPAGMWAATLFGNVYMNNNLGVQNTTPSYPIDVNGNIRCITVIQTSDIKLKENIKNIDTILLNHLITLKPVSYNYKIPTINSYPSTDTGRVLKNLIAIDSSLYSKKHYGFIAQDMETLFPELVYTDKEGIKSIDYISLIPIIIKTLQEYKILLDEKNLLIENLSQQITTCCNNTILKSATAEEERSMQSATLYQNTPNPFSQNTEIRYIVPSSIQNAKLYIFNLQGTQVKSFNIIERGSGAILIAGNELEAGMYLYTLMCDNKEIDTKKMFLTR